MKTKSRLFALLAILMIGVATSCEKENVAMAEIHGEVAFNDNPFQGATVNMYSATYTTDPFTGYSKQALTKEGGKFDFENLSKGAYYLFAFLVDDHDTLSRDKIIIITTDEGTYEADIHIKSENHVD